MGVQSQLQKYTRRIILNGHIPLILNERETFSGGVTRHYVYDYKTGKLLRPESIVYSTNGTHPYTIYSVEPGQKLVIYTFERSNRGNPFHYVRVIEIKGVRDYGIFPNVFNAEFEEDKKITKKAEMILSELEKEFGIPYDEGSAKQLSRLLMYKLTGKLLVPT